MIKLISVHIYHTQCIQVSCVNLKVSFSLGVLVGFVSSARIGRAWCFEHILVMCQQHAWQRAKRTARQTRERQRTGDKTEKPLNLINSVNREMGRNSQASNFGNLSNRIKFQFILRFVTLAGRTMHRFWLALMWLGARARVRLCVCSARAYSLFFVDLTKLGIYNRVKRVTALLIRQSFRSQASG